MAQHVELSLDALRGAILGALYFDYRDKTLFDHNQKVLTRDTTLSGSISRLVLHCTDASGWTPQHLSDFFVNERGFPCCAYHLYATARHVFHMISENIITYHCAPWNKNSLAVSLDFHASRDEQLKIAIDPNVYENGIKALTYYTLLYKIHPKNIVGHRELQFTGWFMKGDKIILRKICPGLSIDLNKVRYTVTRNIQTFFKEMTGKSIAVDGIYGKETDSYMKLLNVNVSN